MKKLLSIIVLGLLLSGNSYASKIGKGNIQFNNEVTKNFIRFLRNEYAVSFVVTPDGSYSTYGICGTERCKGGMTTVLKCFASCTFFSSPGEPSSRRWVLTLELSSYLSNH